MTTVIDRRKLENGSMKNRIAQVYALTRDDIISDPSIIEILRANLKSNDPDLLDISIMRLAIRGEDVQSRFDILNILSMNRESLVRSAAIASLSSLYRLMKNQETGAFQILSALKDIPLSQSELQQVAKDFGLTSFP